MEKTVLFCRKAVLKVLYFILRHIYLDLDLGLDLGFKRFTALFLACIGRLGQVDGQEQKPFYHLGTKIHFHENFLAAVRRLLLQICANNGPTTLFRFESLRFTAKGKMAGY